MSPMRLTEIIKKVNANHTSKRKKCAFGYLPSCTNINMGIQPFFTMQDNFYFALLFNHDRFKNQMSIKSAIILNQA